MNRATGGLGGPAGSLGGAGQNAQAIGSAIFLAGSVTWDVSTGETVTLTDTLGGGTDAQITGGLTKTGGGTLSLGGANSYTGDTLVSAGTLALTNAGALGGSTNITVENGASLTGSGTFNFGTKAFTFNGAGVGGNGALRSVTGSQIFSGQVTLTGDTLLVAETGTLIRMQTAGLTSKGAVALTVESRGNSNFVAAGPFTGITSLTKNGTGGMELSGTNSISGPVALNAGSLEIYNGSAIGDLAAVTVGTSAVFGINTSETIGSLAGVSTVLLRSGATLTTGGNNDSTTYSGQMGDTGSLVKEGTGTFIMSRSSTYSGSTTINGGTLQIGDGGTTGEFLNTSGIINNANLTFNRSNSFTHAKPISGTGTLTKRGAGILTLTTANSYEGGTTLDAGTLALTGAGSVGSGPVNFVAEKVAIFRVPAGTVPSNVVKGFGFGHAIVLAEAGTATTATLAANHVLTITGGTVSPIVLNFDPAQSFAGLRFKVAADGSGGTRVTLGIAPLEQGIAAGTLDLFTATGLSVGSGIFSGTGVTAGLFDPQATGVGAQTVTFTPTGGSPETFTVTVTENPSLTVTTADDGSTNADGLTSLREALAHAATLAGPQTITFSNTNANGAVNFHDATAEVILLGGTPLAIESEVEIDGPGSEKLTIDGNSASRVFTVDSGSVDVTIEGLTITHGLTSGNAPANTGGGIRFLGTGILTIDRCRVVDNEAGGAGGGICLDKTLSGTIRVLSSEVSGNTSASFGGGICSEDGILEIIDSTIAGNTSMMLGGGILSYNGATILRSTISENNADAHGGGILAYKGVFHIINSTIASNIAGSRGGALASIINYPVTVNLVNSTVAGNDAGSSGGGIYLFHPNMTLNVENSIVALNTAPTAPDIDVAAVVNQSASLIGVDPGLEVDGSGKPLLDLNGGATRTIALLPGSPAIDAGDDALALDEKSAALSTDQRGSGFDRIVKGLATSAAATVDIGAFELFAAPGFTTDQLSVSAVGAPVNLASATGVSPAGGVFSDPGVSGGLFDPRTQRPGIYTLTYTVTDAFGVINTTDLTMTVVAVPSALTLSQPKRFKTTILGERSRVQRVSVRNVGGLPLKSLRVEVSGRAKKDFEVTQPILRSVEAGASTSFEVTFRPRKEGVRRALVTVYSDSAPVSVKVKGRGQSTLSARPPRAVK